MVTSQNLPSQAQRAPFSFAEELYGNPQPVTVSIGGLPYPGEVIVSDEWRSEFGAQLEGTSMFRLVLIQSDSAPRPDEISDPRICVAVQGETPQVSDRVAESRAVYNIGSEQATSRISTATDMRSIRELRQNYSAISDPDLDRLTSALTNHESRINESVAGELQSRWKSGLTVVANRVDQNPIDPDQLFLMDDPNSWIDIAAFGLIGESILTVDEGAISEITTELRNDHVNTAKDLLLRLCGIRLNEETPLDRLNSLLATSQGNLSGTQIVALLSHELNFSPVVGILWLAVHVIENDSEIEFVHESGTREYLSIDIMSDFDLDTFHLINIVSMREEKSLNWDAVLPYLRLIVPHSNSTRFGGGRLTDEEEFARQLASLAERVRSASPVMLSLEVAAGAIERPLTSDDQDLLSLLGGSSWQEYVVHARAVYGSVARLRAVLTRAALRWSAVEYAAEIEKAIYYLDQIDFGRLDHGLAAERHILRSRFDLETLVDSPATWLSLRDEFERWRQDYRRAYLEDHADKQEHNRNLQSKISGASKLVTQIQLLERVEAVSIGTVGELGELWEETIRYSGVCNRDGADILLIDEPVCQQCHGRLGQPANHTDIIEMISNVESIFDGYRDRLATVVSRLVLESGVPDRLLRLFQLNSAGDLSGLANVLDDKVISFLNDLFGRPDGSSGSVDDWMSPQS